MYDIVPWRGNNKIQVETAATTTRTPLNSLKQMHLVQR